MASILKGAALALALVLGATASAQAQRGVRGGGVIEAGELRFGAVGAQELPAGACGLFLWGRASINPVLVAAAFDRSGDLVVNVNGRERRLARTAFEGVSAWGHFARTTYADRNLSIEIEVSFDANRPIQDGAMVERGVMRVRDGEGWETMIPVGGMAACQR